MRSTSRHAAAEPTLALDVPDADPSPVRRRRGGPARDARVRRRAGAEAVHRLGSDALSSLGFPAGTLMTVDTARKPRRGQILFVRTGGRLKVGVLEVQFGRSVLRSDHGTIWLDPAAEIWGVAIAADPPLEGLL